MSEALGLMLRLNLAASAAVLVVLALRHPARRLFGARIAYGLWLLAPLAALAMLLPPRVIRMAGSWPMTTRVTGATHAAVPASAPAALAAPGLLQLAAVAWLAGALYALARLVWRQAQFTRAVRAGRAGPAVVGVLKPRIVTPADFAHRYTERERQLVLAHEATHLARHDSRVNALVALVRCLAWFNPLAHALARCLRIDQELACDAQVIARHPAARRAYAEAMLKTQLTLSPLPLGCYWPASAAHPLAQRIDLLARPTPGRLVRLAGVGAVALTALAVGWSAWAARPPELVWIAPTPGPATTPAVWAPASAPPRPAATPATRGGLATTPAPAPASPTPQPERAILPVSTAIPPEGCGEDLAGPPARRRLAPGDFGPARRIHSAANWSSVEPGTAVRVYATAADPSGVPLITDLTAFGSQSWYRVGCIRSNPSPERLFTSVTQHGDRFTVQASIREGPRWTASGTVDLASGETGEIALPDGRKVTVSAVARPETPQEIEAARSTPAERLFVNAGRFAFEG